MESTKTEPVNVMESLDGLLNRWQQDETVEAKKFAETLAAAVARVAFGKPKPDDVVILADAIQEKVITREQIDEKIGLLDRVKELFQLKAESVEYAKRLPEIRQRLKQRKKETEIEISQLSRELRTCSSAPTAVNNAIYDLGRIARNHPELFEPFDMEQVAAGYDWDKLKLRSI
jgi:hypothetical protein